MSKKLGELSETELLVMNEVWQLGGEVKVSRLLPLFEESKGWKTSTVSTILNRLIEKGFLTKELSGKANIYKATLTLDEYKKYKTKTFMNRIHGNNIKSFIAALVDGDVSITADDISELRKWLRDESKEE
jgi:Predicted transcriptional regulator